MNYTPTSLCIFRFAIQILSACPGLQMRFWVLVGRCSRWPLLAWGPEYDNFIPFLKICRSKLFSTMTIMLSTRTTTLRSGPALCTKFFLRLSLSLSFPSPLPFFSFSHSYSRAYTCSYRDAGGNAHPYTHAYPCAYAGARYTNAPTATDSCAYSHA